MSFSQGKINFLVNAIMEFAIFIGRRSMLWLNIVPIEGIMGLIQLPHIPIEKLNLANLISTPLCAELIKNSTMLGAQFNCLVGCQSTWCLVHCSVGFAILLCWTGWYCWYLVGTMSWSIQNRLGCSFNTAQFNHTWYLVQYFSSNQLLDTAQFNCLVGCPSTTYLVKWYAKFSKL